MLQGLLGYSPHKAATGQVMTKWDHNVRTWMENVMATAYGVAPVLSFPLDDVPVPYEFLMETNAKGKLVPKLDARDMPIVNPNYDEEVFEFGKKLAPRFHELKNRQAFGRRAAHGFNITLELLRRARNLNFANEVRTKKKGGGCTYTTYVLWSLLLPFYVVLQFRDGSPYRRLGLLNGNRFGQFFFDNVPQLATEAIKAFEKPNLEQQAAAMGKPVVELERERRYIYSKAQVHDRPQTARPQQGSNFPPSKKKKKKKKNDKLRWPLTPT
jgi:hypothetical protein